MLKKLILLQVNKNNLPNNVAQATNIDLNENWIIHNNMKFEL